MYWDEGKNIPIKLTGNYDIKLDFSGEGTF